MKSTFTNVAKDAIITKKKKEAYYKIMELRWRIAADGKVERAQGEEILQTASQEGICMIEQTSAKAGEMWESGLHQSEWKEVPQTDSQEACI